jgi:pimeloyl-ACP methyl ester carboxylesterase
MISNVEVKSRMVRTRWGPMHIREIGQTGEPMVLVHGLGVSGRYFIPAGQHLARDFRVLIPDLPGSGKSVKPRPVLTIPDLANVLLEWTSAAGLQPAHWVGNSLGCQIIAELAARVPAAARTCVLQGPTVDSAARSTLRQFGRLLLDAPREPFSEALIAVGDYIRFGPRRFVRTFYQALADPIEVRLPRMTMPTLVVRGSRDPIVPQRWAEEVTSLLPNGKLITVPGLPHTVNYIAAAEFAEIVREFIRTSRAEQTTALSCG